MCWKNKEIVSNYNAPIFSVCCFKSLNILSVGGGGKRFGIPNKLVSYRKVPPSDLLCESNRLYELDTKEDIVEYLTMCSAKQLMAGVSDQEVLIF